VSAVVDSEKTELHVPAGMPNEAAHIHWFVVLHMMPML